LSAATIEAAGLASATPPELARIANREHALVIRAARSMAEHAIRAGQALQGVKDQLAHGEWGPWLRANFEGSERTAQDYMRLARYPQRAADMEEPSIRQALKAIRAPEDRPLGSLRDEFGEPPFSVLDRRTDQWKKRRETWLSRGIRSELGRSANLLDFSATVGGNRTSVFDPVVCELAYRWFCPPGGLILDPFAGGSVRGIVAGALGRRYLGIDLRRAQIETNREQAEAILSREDQLPERWVMPRWIVGDAMELTAHLVGEPPPDLIFTSPPYGDLERYSDDPRDLSTMPYPQFREALGAVIATAIDALGTDRFAAVVVADIRDRDRAGFFRGLVGDTEAAFKAAGARPYNRAVIIDPLGSAPVRAKRQFGATRKLVSAHQELFVGCKGDPHRAAAATWEAGAA
jgi:hypothetical protein